MKLGKPARYAVCGALILVYILLRYWNLTASCLWFDEIFSVHAAEHSWSAILDFVAQDLIHPPLFYILLKIWTSIGGDGLLWLRLFPLFFGVVSLAPFFLLCREIELGSAARIFALLLFAVNGSLIKYSQEVRMYAPLLCFSLVSLWLFVRFFKSGKGLMWLVMANAIMVYTHYFGWLVILSEVIAIAVFKRERLVKILLSSVAVMAAFVPWIMLILKAAPAGEKFAQNIGWMQRPGLVPFFQLILNLFEPLYFKASSAEFASNYLISIPLLGLIIFALGNYYRDRADSEPLQGLLLVFSVVPVLTAFIASWILPYSVWGARHLIIVFVPFIIFVVIAVERTKIRYFRPVAAIAFGVLAIGALGIQFALGSQTYIWCGWEVLAKDVENSPAPAKVYAFEDLSAYHLWFALRKQQAKFDVDKLQGLENIKEDTAYFLPRGFSGVRKLDINTIDDDHFWIAFRAEKWDVLRSPLFDLIARGYSIGEPRVFEAGRDKAFLVEIKRQK